MRENYVSTSVHIPEPLANSLNILAKRMGRSRNNLICRIIEIYVKEEEKCDFDREEDKLL